MAATNEDIKAAVLQLDPSNDEQWTADGQPRLDAVENLLGSDVSRKVVTNAAPGHTRGHAQSLVDAEHDEETAGPTEEVYDEAPSAPPEDVDSDLDQQVSGDMSAAGDTAAEDRYDNDNDPLATGPAEQEADMNEDIQKLEDDITSVRGYLETGRQELAQAELALAKAITDKNAAFPPMTASEAIQAFQKNEAAKRAEVRGMMHGLDEALRSRGRPRVRGLARSLTKE